MNINKTELIEITGGAFSVSLLNAFVRTANAAIEIGRAVGSALRRAVTGKYCTVK